MATVFVSGVSYRCLGIARNREANSSPGTTGIRSTSSKQYACRSYIYGVLEAATKKIKTERVPGTCRSRASVDLKI